MDDVHECVDDRLRVEQNKLQRPLLTCRRSNVFVYVLDFNLKSVAFCLDHHFLPAKLTEFEIQANFEVMDGVQISTKYIFFFFIDNFHAFIFTLLHFTFTWLISIEMNVESALTILFDKNTINIAAKNMNSVFVSQCNVELPVEQISCFQFHSNTRDCMQVKLIDIIRS